jgi:hypothetical protein
MTRVTALPAEDRRRFVSRWFKHQIAVRLTVVGSIVLAAVCLAFGSVGVAAGIGVLTGMAVVIHLRRRRKWSEPGPMPGVK